MERYEEGNKCFSQFCESTLILLWNYTLLYNTKLILTFNPVPGQHKVTNVNNSLRALTSFQAELRL
jgi:hypothetical protein